jgi:hypothetical protein
LLQPSMGVSGRLRWRSAFTSGSTAQRRIFSTRRIPQLAHHVDPGIDRDGRYQRVTRPPCEIWNTAAMRLSARFLVVQRDSPAHLHPSQAGVSWPNRSRFLRLTEWSSMTAPRRSTSRRTPAGEAATASQG